ncbi:hypothetical protein Pcinc_041445 [Petrolisthes cinctipes]|uniref:Uncharacterized protein n=1 Tax=Petrolisthes cinctipes TaxID=88211 RepID=A0AAE1BK60_PETCI|nr:hypothetical protein Pcinc_041445 [Petrolisthes cinctipes]
MTEEGDNKSVLKGILIQSKALVSSLSLHPLPLLLGRGSTAPVHQSLWHSHPSSSYDGPVTALYPQSSAYRDCPTPHPLLSLSLALNMLEEEKEKKERLRKEQ